MTRATFITVALCALLCATPGEAQPTRDVTVTPRSVVPIATKLRYTTMIILPEGEEILDVICGDRDFWIISGAQNFAYIKPAKAGAATNVNLVARSGAVYSFVLTEGAATPDLKVFILPDRPLTGTSGRAQPALVGEVARLQHQAEEARTDADAARKELQAARGAAAHAVEEGVGRFRASYPAQLRFPYRYKPHAKPFLVSAIFHDGRSTYIHLGASEVPAVYEMTDGAASLVNIQAEPGVLIVPKVIETGYLAIGKQRFLFHTRPQ